MNYSCLPNEDGSLKASKRMSTTVGMDLDWTPSPLPLEGEEQIAARKEEWLRMVPEQVLSKKEELGLLMLERSATKGYHLVFRRRPELSQEDNLRWAAGLLGVEFDEGAKDITRVFFTTTEDDLIYLSDSLFEIEEVEEVKEEVKTVNGLVVKKEVKEDDSQVNSKLLSLNSQLLYHGIPYSRIVDAWLEGKKVKEGDRHRTSLYLADHLRYITDNDAALIEQILRQTPFVQEIVQERGENVAQTVKSAQSYDFYKNIPKKMQQALRRAGVDCESEEEDENLTIGEDPEDNQHSMTNGQWRKMPQGVKDSIDAVGPSLAMPVLTAICPCIGALATGVVLDVHGQKKGLNLISYIAGDFASGKGAIDPVIEAWMSEVSALDKMYQMQEDEWRAKKRAAKNKKEQPEEPKLPVRFLTLNNTVANLAERLANTEGKHAFSFTPEADTVAQKWKSTMSDFSVMLRQSYDGTRYDREARSADAVNVHIEQLLWNVTMCGTPDALYRVVSNYTDGFQSRIALARTPDNTFSPLEEKPYVLTPRQTDHIQQVAHLLPLMHGEVVLPKLERNGRKWLESIRLETMMNDDKVRARQRFRVCVTAQRMTCCLMLCKVCETLIQKHGLSGAEARLKQYPDLWKEMLLQAQTPQMMNAYDVIADSLLENALHFFRDRIENAFSSHDYIGDAGSERVRRGKNDSIYERLDIQFTFEQAMQQSVAVKGAGVTHNSVKQMLKNWKNQHLIAMAESGEYRKVSSKGH
ncbi:MAG: DUF3987 domain-containing protein [Bacteroidaceae bacterium]|nr:DUF3987 domain-containing protein [Bacteroidaceae bacterium]